MSELELTRRVGELAAARAALAQSTVSLRAKREAFDAENAELIARTRAEQDAVASAEQIVRQLGAEVYAATQRKKVCAGVEVAVGTDYQIDEVAAFAWAREKQLCLIPEQLDVAAIKKLATVQPLPFATPAARITVRIATDLTKALSFASVQETP